MPEQYNPFADLEAYGADMKARRGAAAATSAQADSAALKFGLQNLEGNQAMSKQRLVNQGDETKARITGSYSQGIHPDTPLMQAMKMLTLAKRANTVKDTMDAAHAGAQAGLMMPMGGELEQPQDWLEQGLKQGEPTAQKAARETAKNQNTSGVVVARQEVKDKNGNVIGFATPETTTTTDSDVQSISGSPSRVPTPNVNRGPGKTTPQQPAANPAQGALDKLKSSGAARPDTQLTGQVDARGRHQIKDGSGRTGWLSQ